VEDHGEEDEETQRHRDHEAGGDGNAVEEGVSGQADDGRVADRRIHHHVVVNLLSEMEMRGHGVLEEVNEEIARQDE
jgi:hypothetical protein